MQTPPPPNPCVLCSLRQCRHPPLSSLWQCRHPPCLPSDNADILPTSLWSVCPQECMQTSSSICLQATQTSSLSAFRQCRHPPLVPVVCLHSGIACRRHPLSAFRKCRHHPLSTFRKCRHPPLSPSDNTDIHPYLPQTMQTPSPLSRSKRTAPLSGGNRKSRVDKDLFSPGKVTL